MQYYNRDAAGLFLRTLGLTGLVLILLAVYCRGQTCGPAGCPPPQQYAAPQPHYVYLGGRWITVYQPPQSRWDDPRQWYWRDPVHARGRLGFRVGKWFRPHY